MKSLAKIITKNKNVVVPQYIAIEPFDKNNSDIYGELPTLIIGKKNAEKIYGKENIHVLDKKIKDNVWWCYGEFEKRDEYEQGIIWFVKKVTKILTKSIKYEYINPYTSTYSYIKNIIQLLKSNDKKIAYLYKEHIYLYCNNVVYGLSLIDTKYIGITNKKIGTTLRKARNIKFIKDDFFINNETKKAIQYSKIMIPYLYWLNNQ